MIIKLPIIANEAPGLFALIKTPEIDFKVEEKITYYSPNSVYIVSRMNTGFGIEFKNGKIEYALNPAAEIDLEKTKIYASIEFDLYTHPRNFQYSGTGSMGSQPYNFYDDFWGIDKGIFQQVGNFSNLPNQSVNNFYSSNKYYFGTPPLYYNHIKSGNSVLYPNYFNVQSMLVPIDDVKKQLKFYQYLQGNNSCQINEQRLNMLNDVDITPSPENSSSALIWNKDFKDKISILS